MKSRSWRAGCVPRLREKPSPASLLAFGGQILSIPWPVEASLQSETPPHVAVSSVSLCVFSVCYSHTLIGFRTPANPAGRLMR